MHPVWTSVLERILGEGWESAGVIELGAKREEMLSSLWTVVVEGCLATGTDERKVSGQYKQSTQVLSYLLRMICNSDGCYLMMLSRLYHFFSFNAWSPTCHPQPYLSSSLLDSSKASPQSWHLNLPNSTLSH